MMGWCLAADMPFCAIMEVWKDLVGQHLAEESNRKDSFSPVNPRFSVWLLPCLSKVDSVTLLLSTDLYIWSYVKKAQFHLKKPTGISLGFLFCWTLIEMLSKASCQWYLETLITSLSSGNWLLRFSLLCPIPGYQHLHNYVLFCAWMSSWNLSKLFLHRSCACFSLAGFIHPID